RRRSPSAARRARCGPSSARRQYAKARRGEPPSPAQFEAYCYRSGETGSNDDALPEADDRHHRFDGPAHHGRGARSSDGFGARLPGGAHVLRWGDPAAGDPRDHRVLPPAARDDRGDPDLPPGRGRLAPVPRRPSDPGAEPRRGRARVRAGLGARRQSRGVRQIRLPSLAAVGLVFVQAALGGVVVKGELEATLVTLHFATAMTLLAVLVNITANSFCFARLPLKGPSIAGSDPRFARLALGAVAAAFALLIVGASVRPEAAGLAFRDWPLMDGRLVPTLGGVATLMFVHRVLAALVLLLVIWVAIRARTMTNRSKDLVILSTVTLLLYVAQILVGAANVWSSLSAASVTAHVVLSALIWGVLVAIATVSRRFAGHARGAEEGDARSNGKRSNLRETTAAYFKLTKPPIIVLLLITTVPAMVLAQRGLPSLGLIAATLVGGTIAA